MGDFKIFSDRFPEGCEHYERSHAIKPNPDLLNNIAQVGNWNLIEKPGEFATDTAKSDALFKEALALHGIDFASPPAYDESAPPLTT